MTIMRMRVHLMTKFMITVRALRFADGDFRGFCTARVEPRGGSAAMMKHVRRAGSPVSGRIDAVMGRRVARAHDYSFAP